jgi:hypothetical protein
MKAGRTLGRCGFALFGVALGIAGTEAVLQLVPALVPLTIRVTLATKGFSTIRPHPRCGYVYRPGLDTLYSPTAEMSYRFRTVRSPDPTIGLRDDGWSGRPWAVALGDSFTSGMGVELEETWAERLETKLGRDVVNLGVDGYSSLHETALLRAVGLPLAPAVALFLVNFNDPGDCIKFIEAAPLHAREVATFTEAVLRAPRRRPVAAAGDPATTLAGWVAPLPRRAVPRLVARASRPQQGPDGVVSFAEEATVELPLEAGRGFTLAVRFAAPAAGGAAAKGKKATRLLRVQGASGGLDLLLLSDGRVRVDLGGDPDELLTSLALGGAAAVDHVAVVSVVDDDGVVLAVDDQPERRGRFAGRAAFAGPLRCTVPKDDAHRVHELRGFEGACTRFEVGGEEATAGESGPRGPWINSDSARGLHSTVDREGRLHVVVLGDGPPLEAVATRAVARDRPTHLACVVSATGLELSVDGAPAGAASGAVALPCLGDVVVGRDGDRRGFVGTLGATSVFAARFGAAELSRLATRAADGRAPEPGPESAASATALWRGRSGDYGVLMDDSGCGNAAHARGEFELTADGDLLLQGRGAFEARRVTNLEGLELPAGPVEAGRSTLYLLEMVHLFRRDGVYALSSADTNDWLPFASGPIDQVFRRSAVEGRLFRPDKNALEFCEGVGYVLEALADAEHACTQAGVKLVAITSASKEAVYFPQAKAVLGEEVVKSARPDWVQRDVEQWCARHGVPCISLLEPLRKAAARGENLYFRIDPHWNARGHAVAAEAIEAGLRELGLLR